MASQKLVPLFLLSLWFVFLINVGKADTIIDGGQVSGIWTVENSPYIVTANIYVEDSQVLEIQPGVEVRFDSGVNLSLSHEDGLLAEGTRDSLIIFSANQNNPGPGDWNGIYLYGTRSRVKFRHCVLEYATTAIRCQAWAEGCEDGDNYTVIDSCVIRFNSGNGLYLRGAGSSSSGCTFAKTGSCNPKITNNWIYENGADGIDLVAYDGYHANGYVGAEIIRNVIMNNRQNGIDCAGDDPANPKIINNTILDNDESGIRFRSNFSADYFFIINNIIGGNDIGINSVDDSVTTEQYNNVWNNRRDFQGISPGTGDISTDPLFVDAENRDFNLTGNSPCIDAGDPDQPHDPDNTIADIGAFYFSQLQPPVADFTAEPDSGVAPLTVQFSDKSTGEITSYSWDFGDGQTSLEASPRHTYTLPDTYTVSLQVEGPDGSDSKTVTDLIRVGYPPPVAAFTATPDSGEVPLTVEFKNQSSGEITSYFWDFGDSTTSTEESPAHTYNEVGFYSVSLVVTGPAGTDSSRRENAIQVVEPQPPVAAFEASPVSGVAPLAVEFANQSTGKIDSFFWEFGDGDTSSVESPEHTYQEAGIYTVKLTVTGPGGNDTEVLTDYIQVSEKSKNLVSNPEFDEGKKDWLYFYFENAACTWRINEQYLLSGRNSSQFEITNGSSSDWHVQLNQYIPLHKNKYYEIRFKAKLLGAKSKTIAVVSQEDNSPYTEYFDRKITLVDTVEDYGPIFIYSDDEDPTARLKFFMGETSNITIYLDQIMMFEYNKPPAPIVDFTATSRLGEAPFRVFFQNKTLGFYTSQLWAFGDGNTADAKNATHTYEEPGVYDVSLTAYGTSGDTVTVTKKNYISVNPTLVDLTAATTPTSFVLQQNYPNPFNPQTKIGFSLPRDTFVNLSVFNLRGEEVAQILHDRQPAGNHSVVWHAAEIPAGTYFIKLKADNFEKTIKAVLIK